MAYGPDLPWQPEVYDRLTLGSLGGQIGSTDQHHPAGRCIMGSCTPCRGGCCRAYAPGASLAEALRRTRLASDVDPVTAATGWSFICLGSG